MVLIRIIYFFIGIFSQISCDTNFQRKPMINKVSDISTDWKPLSIRDMYPSSAMHQGFMSVPNPVNRNKLQFSQIPHHNSQFLRQFQSHPVAAASQRNYFPSAIYTVPHLAAVNVPRYNHLGIQPNVPPPLPPHIFSSGAGLMKTPLPKALVKPEPYTLKSAPIFDLKHIKTGIYNGLHTTTAKIPTHHIRSSQFYKSYNTYPFGDSLVVGSISTSPSIYGATNSKGMIPHQNVIGHTMLPTFKKFPVTNPPTGLGHTHLVSNSFLPYSYPLVGKTTNHFPVFQPPAVTTSRTQINLSENALPKYQPKPQENTILKPEIHLNSNSVHVTSSSEASFVPLHKKSEQNLPSQLLPPVPASVLAPFFVPLHDQEFLNLNNSEVNSNKLLYKHVDNDNTYSPLSNNNSSKALSKDLFKEESVKIKEPSTTIRTIEISEQLKVHDGPQIVTPIFSSSPSSRLVDDFRIVDPIKNVITTGKPINSEVENSNSIFPPPFKLEKFSTLFNHSKSTSFNFLPTPQVHNNFFTFEDAITVKPFKDTEQFEGIQVNRPSKISIQEKPLNLKPSSSISPVDTKQNFKGIINNHPPRYRPKQHKPEIQSFFTTVQSLSVKDISNQTEKKFGDINVKGSIKIEASSEKPMLNPDDSNRTTLRKKPNPKNFKRYQYTMRRNNATLDGIRSMVPISSVRQNNINFQHFPASSPSSTITTTTSTSTTNNRVVPMLMVNKVPYSRVSPSLNPVFGKERLPHFTHAPQNVGNDEEFSPIESTQSSTIRITTPNIGVIQTTTNFDWIPDNQETPIPTINIVAPKTTFDQQLKSHTSTVPSVSVQISSSSENPKQRHRLKHRKHQNTDGRIRNNTSRESPSPHDSDRLKTTRTNRPTISSSSKETISSTTEFILHSSERPKFSIRNYRQRPQSQKTITADTSPAALTTPTTTTTTATTTTTTTTTTAEPPVDNTSITNENHRTNGSYTTRKRLLPSLQYRTQHNNGTENPRKRNRTENRNHSSENSSVQEISDQNKSSERRPTRRRGSEVRRTSYSQRNSNTISSRESPSKANENPSISSTSSTPSKEGGLLIRNIARRPTRISLKEKIQNHLNRKSNENQTNKISDDLLNITLDTKSNNVETTTPSNNKTPKIESAIMKIAKDDHSQKNNNNGNGVSSSGSLSTRLSSYQISRFTSSPTSSSSSSSSSTFAPPAAVSSSEFSAEESNNMSNISRYVDELTASSSSNSLNILNRGIHTRRIPNYFTLATEDPILPIEAFFPNVLKDTNNDKTTS